MDLEPPFCTKNAIFGQILVNFSPEISSPDPNMMPIGMKLLYGEAGILETHS